MADVTYFGLGAATGFALAPSKAQPPPGPFEVDLYGSAPTGYASPDAKVVPDLGGRRAEVSFEPAAPTGFPAPDVTFFRSTPGQAEVYFEGIFPAPQATPATVVEIYSPTLDARAEFTQVELVPNPATPLAASENPNINFYELCPTGSAPINATAFHVVALNPVPPLWQVQSIEPYLDGIAGANGLNGSWVIFGAPTGGGITQLTGQRRQIASHTENEITLASALPATPTNTDRFYIEEVSRLLRRTPVLEIILG